MNNTIKLAVASALLAAASSASAAGGIVAGDWTLDIGGVVNAYYTSTKTDGGKASTSNETGLLPNVLAVSGKTRQNDLDVAFTISIQPGSATNHGLANYNTATQENRQAFLTFGDASWGSIKAGKDLGIYASGAILNDMTLLGVGAGAGAGQSTTTLGRIGGGYIYADWKSQFSYTTPNFNGFSATAGVTQAWNATQSSSAAVAATSQSNAVAASGLTSAVTNQRGGGEPAFEAQVSYAFAGDVSGKVWASGISQNVELNTATGNDTASAWDIGANVNAAGFGLTGYYGEGKGLGTVIQFRDGYTAAGVQRKSDDWYTQATYTLPGVGTKLGVSYGESTLDGAGADAFNSTVREQTTFGAYHPLTKHLNLVAEYSNVQSKNQLNAKNDSDILSAGAILFF